MISLNEYDDIVTILFLPLKGANVVKEFQNTFSGRMNFVLQFPAEKYQVNNQYLINRGKFIICKKWPLPTFSFYFRVKIDGQALDII